MRGMSSGSGEGAYGRRAPRLRRRRHLPLPSDARTRRSGWRSWQPGRPERRSRSAPGLRFEENGAEGGAERQRDEAGDHRRGRDRHRELTEEQPGDAGDEGGRHEDGAEREGDRDQRPTDLVHRPMGCLQGRHAVAHVALDVFDDDDRVVDDDADREHEAEQGQVVERYAEGHKDRERPDEGDRNRNDRDDGRSPALQEEEYDATTRRIATKIVTMTSWI